MNYIKYKPQGEGLKATTPENIKSYNKISFKNFFTEFIR
jgi:hypothetical protein